MQNIAIPVPPVELEGFGRLFFDKIFQGELRDAFLASLANQVADEPVSLALHIPETLASIWWELLNFNSDHELVRGFLSLNKSIYFSRYVGNLFWDSSIQPAERLKILAVVSQPLDLKSLDAENEVNILKASLPGPNRVDLIVLENPTIDDFKKSIRTFKPHIMHFIGHATFHETEASGLFLLDDKRERSSLLTSSDLAKIIKRHTNECSLIILNACETATVGHNYDNSIAGSLVQAGIPAVIGMQCKIPNRIALVFCQSFYAYLLDGFCQPVDFALNHARSVIYQTQINMKFFNKYWCAPVLYSRSRDGLLFKFQESSNEINNLNKLFNLALTLDHLSERATLMALAWLREQGARAIPSLSLALSSPNPVLRRRAAQGLVNLNKDLANRILEEHLEMENDSTVREIIVTHLEKVRKLNLKRIKQEKARSIEQQRLELVLGIRNILKETTSQIIEFNRDSSILSQQVSASVRASGAACGGIIRLKIGSVASHLPIIKFLITPLWFSWELARANRCMKIWNQRDVLHQQIFSMMYQHSFLKDKLDEYNQELINLKKIFAQSDTNNLITGWRKLYWVIQICECNMREIFYKLSKYQFKHQRNLARQLDMASKIVSLVYWITMIDKTIIYTSDGVEHTINVE